MKRIIIILSFLPLLVSGQMAMMTMPASQVYFMNLPVQDVYDMDNVDNIIIEGGQITNHDIELAGGNCIRMINCDNVIIKNMFFKGSIREAVSLENCSNVLVINCFFAGNANGVYALNSTGVVVRNNEILNPHGARGGRGQFVQFDACYGANNLVEYNLGYSFEGEGYPEDWISLVQTTTGTNLSPVTVRYNKFTGGGPSLSGGGIMSGDLTGSYQLVEYNELKFCGNYGVAISGGDYNTVSNNIVYDIQRPWSNVGMYIANYSGVGTTCSNATMTNNKSTWTHKDGFSNAFYDAGDCSATTYSGNTSASLSDFTFPSGRWFLKMNDDDVWRLREINEPYRVNETTGGDDEFPPTPARPTANAGSDQSTSGTSVTLNSTGSSSTNGYNYQWVQVTGPVKATIVSPTSSSTSVTGLSVAGVYTFRLVVKEDADGEGEANEFYRAGDADWVTITKT